MDETKKPTEIANILFPSKVSILNKKIANSMNIKVSEITILSSFCII